MNDSPLIPGLGWLQQASSKHVFKQICEEYGLVYFGAVNQHTDEHEMVRGVTMSPGHNDRHYSVGTIHGHDIILVERTDTVMFPGKPREDYTWLILQIDLKNTALPHVFIDAGHHDEAFYDNLFAKFARLTHVDKGVFTGYKSAFIERFRVYSPPDGADLLPTLLSPDAADVMSHHFNHFDFEWYQDHLLVYSTGRPITKHLVEHVIRAGVWLADELNTAAPKKPASDGGQEAEDNQY